MISPTQNAPEPGFAALDTGGLGGQPRGLTTLFFTEMWERFSYYGMRALLVLFMVAPVTAGGLGFDDKRATMIYGNYVMSVFMLSIPGGFIADNFLGARRSVLLGGIVIACGHFALAFQSQTTFFAGLVLIALGTGLLKPNISAMVGSLYSPVDQRRDAGFSIFYMGINIGASVGGLLTGWLAQSIGFKEMLTQWGLNPNHSWHWGFAAAGVGMTLGLLVYAFRGASLAQVGLPPAADAPRPWGKAALIIAGTATFFVVVRVSDQDSYSWLRFLFLAVPIAVALWFSFKRDIESKRIAAIMVFSIAAMIFWAIFEQAGSSLSLFAERLTRDQFLGHSFPSSWFQSANPLYVMLLAPLFAWAWVKLGSRQASSPLKFVLGLVFLGLSFVLMVPAARLTVEGRVSPLWLLGVYFLQTVGEMFLSPVGLSTMTKLAPPRLVGLVMGIWFLAAALGNKLAGVLAGSFHSSDSVSLVTFFWQQALWVGGFTLVFFLLVPWLRKLMGGIR